MSLKIATTPLLSPLLWPLLSTLLLTACFEITDDGGKPSQHNSDGGGGSGDGGSLGDGGSTPDGGATDGGTPDGGATDGGTPDGGATDGGAPDGGTTDGGTTDGGTTAPPDTGIAAIYWNGSAEVVPDESYDGSETLYARTYLSAESLCSIWYPVSGTPTDACASCDWAFDIDGTAGGTADGDLGCDWLLSLYGVTSASDLGLWSFSYGYASDYLGYETMFYDYYGYGWYAMDYAIASYDGATFDYSYFYAAFYFYWDDVR